MHGPAIWQRQQDATGSQPGIWLRDQTDSPTKFPPGSSGDCGASRQLVVTIGSPQVVGREFRISFFGYLSCREGDFHRRAAVTPGAVGQEEARVGIPRSLFAGLWSAIPKGDHFLIKIASAVSRNPRLMDTRSDDSIASRCISMIT
jgi:hypothetical protein